MGDLDLDLEEAGELDPEDEGGGLTPPRWRRTKAVRSPLAGSPPGPGVSGVSRRCTQLLDRTTLYPRSRWAFFVVAFVGFTARIAVRKGFYIVAYGLAIYLLKLTILFLSPQVDPAEQARRGQYIEDDDEDESDEYRPFERRMSEFKVWTAATQAVLFSIVLTFFDAFDLPVFWPILVAYFLVLFFRTMKDRIAHMIEHGYVPFSTGQKKKYNKAEEKKATKVGGVLQGLVESDEEDDGV